MNNTKITIPISYLAAALYTAAKKDTRECFNAVLVEATQVETRVVSTDGNTLSILRKCPDTGDTIGGYVSVIIPRVTVESVVKLAGKVGYSVSLVNRGKGEWALVAATATVPFCSLDFTYPPYTRVVPKDPSGVVAQFDPSLLEKFSKIGKALGTGFYPHIQHNGREGALVTFRECDMFAGVISPRVIEGESVLWATVPLVPTDEKKDE